MTPLKLGLKRRLYTEKERVKSQELTLIKLTDKL